MGEILRALDRNETVTILYRGKPRGILRPAASLERPAASVSSHPAFGMWADRDDLDDVQRVVRALRRGRLDAI
jgi:hypothetical protein